MTNRKEFQEWLNRFPEETIIEVGIQQSAGNYESYGCIKFVSPELDDNDSGEGWNFVDFTNNQFVKEADENFNKKFLMLGEPR